MSMLTGIVKLLRLFLPYEHDEPTGDGRYTVRRFTAYDNADEISVEFFDDEPQTMTWRGKRFNQDGEEL